MNKAMKSVMLSQVAWLIGRAEREARERRRRRDAAFERWDAGLLKFEMACDRFIRAITRWVLLPLVCLGAILVIFAGLDLAFLHLTGR